MHTRVADGFRIHFNSDLSGDVIVQNDETLKVFHFPGELIKGLTGDDEPEPAARVPDPAYLCLNLPGARPLIVEAAAADGGPPAWKCLALQPDGIGARYIVSDALIARRIWLWCDAKGLPAPAPTPDPVLPDPNQPDGLITDHPDSMTDHTLLGA